MMQSADTTHAELRQTVEDLTSWLNVVEVGLLGMLDTIKVNTIKEEEQEEEEKIRVYEPELEQRKRALWKKRKLMRPLAVTIETAASYASFVTNIQDDWY